MGEFKELKVWQRAHEVVVAVYRVTRPSAETELDTLYSQLRRAAVSIAANIAESRGRHSNRDQIRFLRMAQGSAREVECHLLLARDVELLASEPVQDVLALLEEVQRMLASLIRNSSPRPTESTPR